MWLLHFFSFCVLSGLILVWSEMKCWEELTGWIIVICVFRALCLQKGQKLLFRSPKQLKFSLQGRKMGEWWDEWCLKWSWNISKWSCCSNWDSTGEHWNVSMFRAIEVGDGMQLFPWANEFIFPFTVNTLPLSFAFSLLSSCITICFYSAFLTRCQVCHFPNAVLILTESFRLCSTRPLFLNVNAIVW